jgi:hypothetical protein
MCRYDYNIHQEPIRHYYEEEEENEIDYEYVMHQREAHQHLSRHFENHSLSLTQSVAIWNEHKDRNKDSILSGIRNAFENGQIIHTQSRTYEKNVYDVCSIVERTFADMMMIRELCDIVNQHESVYDMARAIYVAKLSKCIETGTIDEFVQQVNDFIEHEEYVEYEMDNY